MALSVIDKSLTLAKEIVGRMTERQKEHFIKNYQSIGVVKKSDNENYKQIYDCIIAERKQ